MAKSNVVPGLSDEQLAVALFIQDCQADAFRRRKSTSALTGNLLVRARAGTGKTYLIIKCLPLMIGISAIAAYNRKIAKEIREKVIKAGLFRRGETGAEVGTFHSYGMRVLRECLPGVRLEGNAKGNAGFYKFKTITERLLIPQHLTRFVRNAIERAQERLFGVIDPRTSQPIIAFSDKAAWLDLVRHYSLELALPQDQHIEMQLLQGRMGKGTTPEQARDEMVRQGLNFAARGIQESIRMAREEFKAKGQTFTGVITFGEMLYLPLFFGMPIPQFDWVCVDEAQDSNPARREMARRMMKPTGHILFVGDDKQAINGWAGADNEALDIIIRDFGCKVFPMTVTFRCGKAIVELAKTIVPDYKAADTNPEGIVRSISEADFDKEELRIGVDENGTAYDALICRNTAPLVKMAYRLIARGVACHVEGRDIGNGLVDLLTRWPHLKTIAAFRDKLNEYSEREIAKLNEKDQEAAAEQLSDKVETIHAIIESMPAGSKVADMVSRVESLFADTKEGEKPNTVTLCSAHRSKGLEFNRVFGLGVAKFMPSKYAKSDWSLVQEQNLEYVLYTRAIQEYVDVMMV